MLFSVENVTRVKHIFSSFKSIWINCIPYYKTELISIFGSARLPIHDALPKVLCDAFNEFCFCSLHPNLRGQNRNSDKMLQLAGNSCSRPDIVITHGFLNLPFLPSSFSSPVFQEMFSECASQIVPCLLPTRDLKYCLTI